MAEVKLPLVGGVSKKALAIGGGAAALLITVLLLRKKSTAAAAATAAPGASAGGDPYPPDGTTGNAGDPNSTDPATGMTYGDEQAGYGTQGYQDTSQGPDYGATGYYDPNTGQWVYGNTGTGQAAATTNQAWAQDAISYLSNQGVDSGALSAALGAYLQGQPVTSDQVTLIDQAIAAEGYPPQAGANNYPPGINESGTASQGGTGGSGGGVTGSGSGSPGPGGTGTGGSSSGASTTGPFQPVRYPAPTGLKASGVSRTGYRLSWNAVKGPHGETPTGYTVATYSSSGALVDEFTVTGTSTSEYGRGGKGLPKGTYHSDVWADGGQQAPPHASTGTITLKG